MPDGLVVVRWDNRIGTVLEAKVPSTLKISPDLTMRIYGAHVLGEERGPGFITMKVRELGIASYFSGTKLNYFVAILLNKDERGEDYEEGITEAAARIFSTIGGKKYKTFNGMYMSLPDHLDPEELMDQIIESDDYTIEPSVNEETGKEYKWLT